MERLSRCTLEVAVLVLLLISQVQETRAQFLVGFYARTCPQAETIISNTVNAAIKNDVTLAASILRMVFHDCFVQVQYLILHFPHPLTIFCLCQVVRFHCNSRGFSECDNQFWPRELPGSFPRVQI